MALLWIEGFEGFGTSVGSAPSPVGVVGRKYLGVVDEIYMDIHGGRLGGYCLQYDGSSLCALYSPGLPTTDDTLVVGFATKFSSSGNTCYLMCLLDGANALGISLRVLPGGELGIYRGSTQLKVTSGLSLLAATWYYIELKVICANSPNGSYEVRVGGLNVLSDTGVDTQVGAVAYHYRFGMPTTSGLNPYFDDLYCLDGSGAVNNDFLGNMRVIALRADADTAANAWTRSGGAENYDLVNEDICDDDTGYVESAVSTTTDLYDYDAVASIADSIKGIQINTVCRETDTNSFSLVTVSKLGAIQSNGAAAAIGTTNYVTKTRLMETDPAGNAWTIANVNAAQFGIKVN
jgi:hypothetical protein